MLVTIFIIFILLVLSALFSCSETAMFSLSRSQVAKFKSSKWFLSKNVINTLSNPRQLLVSILLGNELVNVAIAILIAGLVYEMCEGVAWQTKILISVVVSTPIIVIIGEVIPKNIGIRFAPFLAPACAVFIRAFSYILAPVRILLLKLTDKTIKMFGGNPENVRSMIMEEEFRQMVDMGYDEGFIFESEGDLIHNVLDLADKTVEEVMTPQEGIFAISLDADISSVMAQVRATQFSRIPVYDNNQDDIVGILHLRDLFAVIRHRKIKKLRDIENIIRPAHFAQRKTTLENILHDFQKLKSHMTIIIDEQHKPIGIVTMEDIFGALFE